jgi:hypothetical protein
MPELLGAFHAFVQEHRRCGAHPTQPQTGK